MSGRRLVLPAMGALLLGYAAAHSPLLGAAAQAVGRTADACYFLCSGWVPYGRPLDAAAALLALLLAGWAALVVAGRLGGLISERAMAFGLLGFALVVLPASWVGLLGWVAGLRLLQPPLGPLLTAVPAALILVAARGRGLPLLRVPRLPRGLTGLALLLAVTALALLAGSSIVALTHPPTGYDALSYHAPLAVYYWRDGDLGSYLERQVWAWALAHPGSAEIWFGLLRIAAGERVANLGQLPLAFLGAAAVHALGRRSGLPAAAAVLGGLAFLAAPMVVVQAGMQLNDLAAGALLLCALALSAAPPALWTLARFAGIGLALGMAVATKLAVLPAAAAVLLYLAVRLPAAKRVTLAGVCGLLFLAAVAPWWIRNAALYGNPIFPAALPLVGRGYVVGDFLRKDTWFVPGTWAWPLYPLIETHGEMSGFGALFTVGALPGMAIALWRARRASMALLGLVTVISVVAWWRLTQHEPRLLLGVIGAGFAGLGWTLQAVPRPHRHLAVLLLAGAAVFSAAVTVDQALRPLAVAPAARAEFYEREWGVDSLVAALPEQEGLLYHTGYAHRSYAGDYPLLGPSQGRAIAVVDGALESDVIVATMRAQGFRYAYVPARASDGEAVRAMYPPERFKQVRVSTLRAGHWADTQRYLFRLLDDPAP
ncbi:MAG TPA: hypothetical protein VFZ26_10020 [Gemmatimonadales bacterium]